MRLLHGTLLTTRTLTLLASTFTRRLQPQVAVLTSPMTSPRRHQHQDALETQTYNMDPFSRLRLRSDMRVWVKPLNAHTHPDMDQCILSVWSRDHSRTTADLSKLYSLQVQSGDGGVDIVCHQDAAIVQDSPLFCDLQIPLNADIDAVMENDLDVAKMEGGEVNINMEKGNCRMQDMKCSTVNIASKSGLVSCAKVLHGDVTLDSQHGDFTCDRLQGQKVKITCRNGNIKIPALYAVQSSIATENGNVEITSCHGDTDVIQKSGSLKVGSLDGNLTADLGSGDATIHLTQWNTVNLTAHNGDIRLSTDQPRESGVELTGREVTVGDNVKLVDESRSSDGEGREIVTGVLGAPSDSLLSCTAQKGRVSLVFKEWINTLNIS